MGAQRQRFAEAFQRFASKAPGPPPPFVPPQGQSHNTGRKKRPSSAPSQRSASHRMSEPLSILGFVPDAKPSEAELKRALRDMAMQWHPDRPQNLNRIAEATEKFQAGKQAYDTLMAELKL